MANWDREQAIARYTDLMGLIHVGTFEERDHEGNYTPDGIEKAADSLMFEAASYGLVFVWHQDKQKYSLEPMTQGDLAAFQAAEQGLTFHWHADRKNYILEPMSAEGKAASQATQSTSESEGQ